MQGKFLPNKEEQKKFNIVLGSSDAVELTEYIKFIKEKHDCDLTQAEMISSCVKSQLSTDKDFKAWLKRQN